MIEKFNVTIGIWILELDKFNLNQLLAKPDEDSWSMGQLYQHIIEETNWYNGQIELSLTDVKNGHNKITEEARLLFKDGSFADQIIKGDPLLSKNVKQPDSIDGLKISFEKLKSDTNTIWLKMQSSTNFGKSNHPGIGFLNCFEWIQYSEMHMRHHLKQKTRIENSLCEKQRIN